MITQPSAYSVDTVYYTVKDLARLLPARSLHQSAVNVHHSGAKELSGPTKGATEAACHPVPKGRNGGKVRLIPSSGNDKYSKKKRHLGAETSQGVV